MWLDANGDGNFNNNELGFSGITVYLCDSKGDQIVGMKTDSNGNYSFTVSAFTPSEIQVMIPTYDEATIPGYSLIDVEGYSPVYTLAPGQAQKVPAGIRSMNVTTIQDDPTNPIQNQVTLRDAVETGNNGPPNPAVTFYTAPNVQLTGTIALRTTLPAIAKSYNITGPGASALTVWSLGTADDPYRVFAVNGGVTSTISGLTMEGGNVQNDNGGGILNNGNLTLLSDTVKSAQASGNLNGGSGGGIYNGSAARLTILNTSVSNNQAGTGGGLYNAGGGVVMTSAVITNNKASFGGGGISNFGGGWISAVKTKIQSNTDTGFFGGGVENKTGTFDMVGGSISNNQELKGGGGGVLNSGTMTLANVLIQGNQAKSQGGGVYVGPGTLTLTSVTLGGGGGNANKAGGGGGICVKGGTEKMSQGAIKSNSATGAPGNGLGSGGGGVFVTSGSLTLTKVSISGNVANSNGGGMYVAGGNVKVTGGTTISNKGISGGGGIYVGGGTLSLAGNVKVTKNTVTAATGNGGGLYVSAGKVTISGGSIQSNTTPNNGGGIYNLAGSLTINNNAGAFVTIWGNNAGNEGGGLYFGTRSTTTFLGNALDCIIKGNTAATGLGAYQQTNGPVIKAKLNNWQAGITVADQSDPGGNPVQGP